MSREVFAWPSLWGRDGSRPTPEPSRKEAAVAYLARPLIFLILLLALGGCRASSDGGDDDTDPTARWDESDWDGGDVYAP